MLFGCLQDNPPYNVSGKNGFVLHLLIIFKNGFQLLRNANYPKNNYFVTSLLLVYLMDVQMLYSHYFIAPNGCAQNRRMPTGWYISLHTIGIRSHLLAYGAFAFSMYVGATIPQSILYTSKCTRIFMHSPSTTPL